MGLNDALGYLSYVNPVHGYSKLLSTLGVTAKNVKVKEIKLPEPPPLSNLATPYIQIAAISGACAIFLNAYYSNNYKIMQDEKRKYAFEAANVYHFIHTVPIMVLPMCKRPCIASIVLILTQILYCGPRYYYAVTGKKINIGLLQGKEEYLLMLGWVSMLLR